MHDVTGCMHHGPKLEAKHYFKEIVSPAGGGGGGWGTPMLDLTGMIVVTFRG